jgi:hypothetical protein
MIDRTHNWYLPFIVSIFIMLLGAICAFLMHPERPLEPGAPSLPLGEPAPAE